LLGFVGAQFKKSDFIFFQDKIPPLDSRDIITIHFLKNSKTEAATRALGMEDPDTRESPRMSMRIPTPMIEDGSSDNRLVCWVKLGDRSYKDPFRELHPSGAIIWEACRSDS
jgi:hypothetical protein